MTPGKVNSSDNASGADLSLSMEVSHRDEQMAINDGHKDLKKPIVSFDSDISSSVEKNNDIAPKAKPIDEKLKLEVNYFKLRHFLCVLTKNNIQIDINRHRKSNCSVR